MRLRVTAKRVRREGLNLDGREKMARILERRPYGPGVHGPTSRTRQTDYGKQLREKQRAKLVFGVAERQFRNYFEKATNMKGDTAANLVRLLELRLDNAVFRAGFAKTRAAARQLVSHAHVDVNGKKVTIASYSVKPGDIIAIRQGKREKKIWKAFAEAASKTESPSWITSDMKELTAKVTSLPAGEELKQVFEPQLIIEFYSR
ncbi:30S ribosomal protein S4 [Candidatus Uhrbacteria bacterium]|nr:30S ribosomal protein S4 [Candidatus Uhrbacteria bacterium]